MLNKNYANRVLILDDDSDLLHQLQRSLASNGIQNVDILNSPDLLMERLAKGDVSVLLLDLVMPGASGREMLPLIVQNYPWIPVVMITAVSDVSTAVSCIKGGAFDYLVKPLDGARLFATVNKAISFSEMSRQNSNLTNYLLGGGLRNPENFSSIISSDNKMHSLFKLAESIAPTMHPVLVSGETGTGKELFARALHDASGLEGEFVAVNVAGLDDAMFSDMIFGHKKGAYTGAVDNRDGLIKKASGGTLFLDEVGDIGPESQKKLLRLLQEKEYYRLGSDMVFHSTARIITASNVDFNKLIADGQFREDLYHRLATHRMAIPPLRERGGDIQLLADHFIVQTAEELGKDSPQVTDRLRMSLCAYPFPGNVRELLNLIRNGVACWSGGELRIDGLPESSRTDSLRMADSLKVICENGYSVFASFSRFPDISTVEGFLVKEALRLSDGNKGVAAQMLGVTRPTLNKKIAEAGLD